MYTPINLKNNIRITYFIQTTQQTKLRVERVSQLSSTCQARRASRDKRVESCCLPSSTQPKCMGLTHQTCRVVSSRDETSQVEFGLYSLA